MSADLQLIQGFPKIHLPTPSPESSPEGSSPEVANDPPSTSNAAIPAKENEDADGEICRTPRSEKNKIPAVLECPPAPRKPRRMPSCKRKLTELQFFEILNREEVDEFFRTSFEVSEIIQSKRRNCC